MTPAHGAAQTTANDGREYLDPGEWKCEQGTSDDSDEHTDADTSPLACANDGTQQPDERKANGYGQEEPSDDGAERRRATEHAEARVNEVANRRQDRENGRHYYA